MLDTVKTSVRPMMWHIYNPDNMPLCWDDHALEFDDINSACEFLVSAVNFTYFIEDKFNGTAIKKDILYYDGGYFNATYFRMRCDENECSTFIYPVEDDVIRPCGACVGCATYLAHAHDYDELITECLEAKCPLVGTKTEI